MVPGIMFFVGSLGVLHLDFSTVQQYDFGQPCGDPGAVNRTIKPLFDEFRQISAMIKVSMGEHHFIDLINA